MNKQLMKLCFSRDLLSSSDYLWLVMSNLNFHHQLTDAVIGVRVWMQDCVLQYKPIVCKCLQQQLLSFPLY